MKKNMGNADRAIRLVIAAVLVGLFFTGIIEGTLGVVALVVAGIFTLTTLVGFCPLYTIFGLNSCSKS
ncbi:DUF2892 domain-containing protein [Algoriphagus sp. CAU 1675]|uniref:YgaP family membrane protein n=1 Tax=Algoriphagus sp. CAU 1675 TaxID=3032597 RepID=UPI0023D9EA43|nr:DUF2892 domain-containing protein [Algoriphagus sp. CAU 1675]MDF2158430.1 DUF2892 domain-containing protein [Algoriphagus sp. CAU 1675]